MSFRRLGLGLGVLCIYIGITVALTLPEHSAESELADGMDQNVTLPDGSTRNVREYLSEFVRDYKRVRSTHSRAQLRRASTVGLLSGMVRIEELMKAALSNRTHRFQHDFDASTAEQVLEHLYALDEQMLRDRKAVEFLGAALEVATERRSYEAFREEADSLLRSAVAGQLEAKRKRQTSKVRAGKALGMSMNGEAMAAETRADLKGKLARSVEAAEQHQRDLHGMVKRQVKETMQFLTKGKKSAVVSADEMATTTEWMSDNDGTDRPYETFNVGTSVLGQTLMSKLLGGRFGRQAPAMVDDDRGSSSQNAAAELTSTAPPTKKMTDNEIVPARQEVEVSVNGDGEESESVEEGPGGLVGLIASLSGGDEGSDVGALIGALTGVITNLLGPGGLDIESLISTGTSLIAGLLGGDENFGKVLGVYVGTALDGLSGGGGAANNGQFFGQFLGTVIAYLSADPEDDDLPLKPKIFLQNFFSGSKATISKAGSGEDDPDTAATDPKPHPSHPGGGGSDFFGFIGNIVGSIVAGVTSLIVNTSVGSSGGSSQGSADLLGGASGASSAGSNQKPCQNPCNQWPAEQTEMI